MMSARVLQESALRVSDCVTELLRKQPFFGSLVLRLPLRPDATRETLATDGHEIRYSPRWVAETDSHLIETAMARVVMACALKHHTRRGERDPERWQMASQLVTHALIRDAGFTLPPDAEAWDGLTVEQAYDRLQAQDGDSGDDGNASPDAGPAGESEAGAGQSPPDADDDTGDPSDSADDGDAEDHDGDGHDSDAQGEDRDGEGQTGDDQDGDGQDKDGRSDAPPSHDPSGTGEVMDADARAGDDGQPAEAPVDITAEEQAWDEAMHQALNIARAEGKVPGPVEETKELRNVWDRVQPGDVMPAGECPVEGCAGAAMLDRDHDGADDLRPPMVALMLGLDRLHEDIRAGAPRAPIGAHLKELAHYARKALAAGPRMQPVCNTCGRTGVRVDAWACWDTQAQHWELLSTYEANAICTDCDGECSFTMKPVREAA